MMSPANTSTRVGAASMIRGKNETGRGRRLSPPSTSAMPTTDSLPPSMEKRRLYSLPCVNVMESFIGRKSKSSGTPAEQVRDSPPVSRLLVKMLTARVPLLSMNGGSVFQYPNGLPSRAMNGSISSVAASFLEHDTAAHAISNTHNPRISRGYHSPPEEC